MILVDTSIWIGHLRKGNDLLSSVLDRTEVLTHEFVIGELACGSMRNRREILELLESLPRAATAAYAEVMHLMQSRHLHGRGIGWIDAHLLASAIMSHAFLWTADRNLRGVAESLEIAHGTK
jgi:predicted nucleic acid-binding protein